MTDFQTFVVPYDFSDNARSALDVALDLAGRLGAELHLVHVIQPPSFTFGYAGLGTAPPLPFDMTEVREQAMASLREVAEGAATPKVRVAPHVIEGARTADSIAGLAEELAADLILMGTHGRTGLAHAFVGSVAERTLRTARCPVVTVPSREDKAG